MNFAVCFTLACLVCLPTPLLSDLNLSLAATNLLRSLCLTLLCATKNISRHSIGLITTILFTDFILLANFLYSIPCLLYSTVHLSLLLALPAANSPTAPLPYFSLSSLHKFPFPLFLLLLLSLLCSIQYTILCEFIAPMTQHSKKESLLATANPCTHRLCLCTYVALCSLSSLPPLYTCPR